MIRRLKRDVSLGDQGEALAARALKRAGYTILERNVKLGRNEVDIIAREDKVVAFVEVKTRRTDDPVSPEDNVGYRKQQHLSQAARTYLAKHGDDTTDYRFDVVAVVLPENGKPSIEIFRNAFPEL